MSVSHIITRGLNDGAVAYSKTETVTSGSAIIVDESISNGATDTAVALAFVAAKLKSIWILSDAAITLETNDGTTPDDTIVLAANKPYLWSLSDGYFAVPFSADVTALYVTNASGSAALLQIRAIVDPT